MSFAEVLSSDVADRRWIRLLSNCNNGINCDYRMFCLFKNRGWAVQMWMVQLRVYCTCSTKCTGRHTRLSGGENYLLKVDLHPSSSKTLGLLGPSFARPLPSRCSTKRSVAFGWATATFLAGVMRQAMGMLDSRGEDLSLKLLILIWTSLVISILGCQRLPIWIALKSRL